MPSRSNFLLLALVLVFVPPGLAAEPELVTRGKTAWQLLQDAKLEEATRLLESMLSPSTDPLPQAANEMARRWLTRLDREKVKAGLRTIYAKKIEYPNHLVGITPVADRWGKPWVYELTKPKFITGIAKQTYRLESTTLGPASDLATALAIPYGSRITLRPVRIEAGVVTFQPAGQTQPVLLSPGTSYAGITYVEQVGAELLLTDGDHWALIPQPRR
jgi:hypothetical protein